MRPAIAQKLARRQAHTPGLIYDLMVKLVMPILSKKLSPTFTYKAFPGKDIGVNVYYTKISGGYLANTKHYLKQRNGRKLRKK